MEKKVLTAQIAAKYYGGICEVVYGGTRTRQMKVDGFLLSALMMFGNKDNVSYKLILKPLSDISDEDASHCASLCGLHADGNTIIREEVRVLVNNDTYQMQISENGYCCIRKNGVLYNCNMIDVCDYLRSKSYDLNGLIPSSLAITN